MASQPAEGTTARDWEDAIDDLRRDLERRLDEMQTKVDRASERSKRAILNEETMANLRDRLDNARSKVMDSLETGDDIVREHPLIVLGGALAVGLLLGAVLSRKGND